jgi:hypothetical protein
MVIYKSYFLQLALDIQFPSWQQKIYVNNKKGKIK